MNLKAAALALAGGLTLAGCASDPYYYGGYGSGYYYDRPYYGSTYYYYDTPSYPYYVYPGVGGSVYFNYHDHDRRGDRRHDRNWRDRDRDGDRDRTPPVSAPRNFDHHPLGDGWRPGNAPRDDDDRGGRRTGRGDEGR